ncbi:hypothetical protein [Actinoplanes sp. HUAS TT8]|uniref:hypothetical protein n=1 Tax=Actinoplanes sp. HUAS TT8 TaxID=3447453 RepID=UPI003F522E96
MADLSYFSMTEHTSRFDDVTAAAYVDEIAAEVDGSERLVVSRLASAIAGLLGDAQGLSDIFINDGLNPDVYDDWALAPEQRDQVIDLIENVATNVALLASQLRSRHTPNVRRPGRDPL